MRNIDEMLLGPAAEIWNVDPITSKFGRVDTVSADEVEYDRLAETHFEQICSGVELSIAPQY